MKNIRIIFTICLLSFSFMGFSSEKDTEGNVQSCLLYTSDAADE